MNQLMFDHQMIQSYKLFQYLRLDIRVNMLQIQVVNYHLQTVMLTLVRMHFYLMDLRSHIHLDNAAYITILFHQKKSLMELQT